MDGRHHKSKGMSPTSKTGFAASHGGEISDPKGRLLRQEKLSGEPGGCHHQQVGAPSPVLSVTILAKKAPLPGGVIFDIWCTYDTARK